MKAAIRTRYGPPAQLRHADVDAPVPEPDEALVRVHAASANPIDWHFVRGEPLLVRAITGPLRPKRATVGVDLAGVVESVGANVTLVAPGDEVFGVGHGTFAELARASESQLAPKPERLSFAQAAALPIAGVTALQALRGLEPGTRVLVVGAAGGVGTFAVQLAKAMGAHVTGVCSGRNVDFVRSLGADETIDYTRAPLAGRYERMLVIAGKYAIRELKQLLTPEGTIVLAGAGVGRDGSGGALGPLVGLARARLSSRGGQTVKPMLAKVRRDDLVELAGYAIEPAIEQTLPLEQVADALAVIEGGHTRGKIVISVPGASAPRA